MNYIALILTLSSALWFFSMGNKLKNESPTDLRCDQSDVLQKAVEKIRSDASDRIGHTQRFQRSHPRKPAVEFHNLVNSIAIDLSEVHTAESDSTLWGIKCRATVTIGVPADAMNAIRRDRHSAYATTFDHAQITEQGIAWRNFAFGVELTNGKPVIIDASDFSYPALSLENIVMTTMDSDAVLSDHLAGVIGHFLDRDDDLNRAWNALPSATRSTNLQSQRRWISRKTMQCGDIRGQSYQSRSFNDQIDTFNCQSEMTEARLWEFENWITHSCGECNEE